MYVLIFFKKDEIRQNYEKNEKKSRKKNSIDSFFTHLYEVLHMNRKIRVGSHTHKKFFADFILIIFLFSQIC